MPIVSHDTLDGLRSITMIVEDRVSRRVVVRWE